MWAIAITLCPWSVFPFVSCIFIFFYETTEHIWTKFAGMMFVRSSKIIPHLVIIRVKKHGCQEQFWFLVADPLNIFSCESPNDLFVDTNNECEILCRIHHFIWIWLKKWPPWAILASDWVKMIMNTNNINPIIMKLFNI